MFRAGIGIVFSKTATNNFASLGITGNNQFISPGLKQPAMWLKDGVPIVPVWPNLDPGQQPVSMGLIGTASTLTDHNAGRPPKQVQWSIGFQREITRDLPDKGRNRPQYQGRVYQHLQSHPAEQSLFGECPVNAGYGPDGQAAGRLRLHRYRKRRCPPWRHDRRAIDVLVKPSINN